MKIAYKKIKIVDKKYTIFNQLIAMPDQLRHALMLEKKILHGKLRY